MKHFVLFAVAFLLASSFAQNQTCPDGQVLCEGTEDECILEEYICDGRFIDCSNDADEDGCPCDFGNFWCPNSTICITFDRVCDGQFDCLGGEDEDNEEQDCPPCAGFECEDGHCIPDNWVCDGYVDCLGGDDEREDCSSCNGFECSDGICIPEVWTCDGFRHCSDDEYYVCPCDDGFRCGDGRCIPAYWVCDPEGCPHCADRSDEENCTMTVIPPERYPMIANVGKVKLHTLTSSATLSKRKI